MLKLPTGYMRDAEAIAEAFKAWVERESQTRIVDLQWYDWGNVGVVGPLSGASLDSLCASPDARAMCEWADEQTGRRGTLLQAMAAAEALGLKQPGKGDFPPCLIKGKA